ncbi:general secretion pathway protein G [Thorsellia anophelis DSM 18579]|uniref:Type II secretion system core protein G n=2 Tax=Thorsellia anophelis TaxID=336804 RepID=A0A1I0AVY5_9GAMM|nr:general secretion pathway protein G [Thorsellia anophelis DSM 18579]
MNHQLPCFKRVLTKVMTWNKWGRQKYELSMHHNHQNVPALGVSKQAGLTLIELMVVIVILGILAALIVPNLLGNTEKANKQKAISDITSLENALDMYKLDNQRYPTTEQGLEALVTKPTAEPLPKHYREDGYIRRLPEDPWGNPYLIKQPGDHGKIDIYSFGPDGEPGTEDDIGNWNLTEIE